MPIRITDKTPARKKGVNPKGGIGRPSLDVRRFARAVRGPGIDTRLWVAQGTVGIQEDDGTFNTTDKQAIFVDRLGAVVSVRLEPSGVIVTARYNGVACGRFGFILVPVRPGDEVKVEIPGGDLNSGGISITELCSNETAKIPRDWNNDRVLIQLNVPLEIRGPAIKINSTNLALNDRQVVYSPEDI